MLEIQADKARLRTAALEARAKLTQEERTALSRRICERIEAHPAFAAAQTALFYMPVRGEVDVLPLLRLALRQGKACALPRCLPENRLEFYLIRFLDVDLEPGRWGIAEPKLVPENLCRPDGSSVIIVPGVAYGRPGGRVGYGAGYYDRFLRSLGCHPTTIAPAYGFQLYETIPQSSQDQPVDCIVTEAETIDCRGGLAHD